MRIVVHLYSILQRKTPEGLQRLIEVDIPENYMILDLLNHLEIQIDSEHLLFAVNGRVADGDRQLEDGDNVHLMLPMEGG